jgi:hypothetical protein
MKLRSGKVLLPYVIEKELHTNVKVLKELLANNEEFAKELIKVIAEATHIQTGCTITEMIDATFKDVGINDGRADLLGAAGSLLRLVIGYSYTLYEANNINPEYHDIIQQRLLDEFDVSLAGDN